MKLAFLLSSMVSIASAQINTCAFPLTCSGGTIRHAAQDGTLHVPKTFGQVPGSCFLTNGASGDGFWGSCPGASGGLDTAHAAALIGDSLAANNHSFTTTTALAGYLPLTAGSSKPLTGPLYASAGAVITATTSTAAALVLNDSTGAVSSEVRIPKATKNSTAIGKNVGMSSTTGNFWTGFGYSAGSSSTTGSNWSAIGNSAGATNTTGSNWTAIGNTAGQKSTTGNNWIAIGNGAGFSDTTGNNWTAVGNSAGRGNLSGGNWSAIGNNAGLSNTTGSDWTAIGNNAGRTNTTGGNWVAIGSNAGSSNTTNGGWAAIGYNAGQGSTTGANWTAIGNGAGQGDTSGNYWTAIGYNAGIKNANGGSWLALGNNSGKWQIGSYWFAIDGYGDRGSSANELANTPIIGTLASTAAAQTLSLNAAVTIPVSLTVGSGTGVATLTSGLLGTTAASTLDVDSARASHIADSAKVAGFPNWNHDASYRFIGDRSQNGSTYATTSGMVTNGTQTNIFAPSMTAIHLYTGPASVLFDSTIFSSSVKIMAPSVSVGGLATQVMLANGTIGSISSLAVDSARASRISDSSKTQTKTAHDTAITLRAYAMPLWDTSNAIPKGNGSTGLTASSWTDSATQLRTTTTDTLVAQNLQAGASAQFSTDAYIGHLGFNTNNSSGSAGIRFDNAGDIDINAALSNTVQLRSGTNIGLSESRNGVRISNLRVAGTDTIASLLSKTVLGTDAGGQVIDNSAATLANNTTGSAAKWTTPRNLTIGSSTQALDGTAALTYSLAAIGAQAALSGLTNNVLTKGNGTTGIQSSSVTDNGSNITTPSSIQTSYTGSALGLKGLSVASSAYPGLQINNTGAGTNNKVWEFFSDGSGNLQIQMTNDAQTSSSPALSFARSGTSLSLATFSGPISTTSATIGSLSGVLIGTSGVVSSLSGTNLVLGNGSTIPQSTFQAAGSYLTTPTLSTNAIPKWNGSTFINSYLADDGTTIFGTHPIISGGLNNQIFSQTTNKDIGFYNYSSSSYPNMMIWDGNKSADNRATAYFQDGINIFNDAGSTSSMPVSWTRSGSATTGVTMGAQTNAPVFVASATGTVISAPNGIITQQGHPVETNYGIGYGAGPFSLTTTPMSVLGLVTGSFTIPANTMVVGSTYRLTVLAPSVTAVTDWRTDVTFDGSGVNLNDYAATYGSASLRLTFTVVAVASNLATIYMHDEAIASYAASSTTVNISQQTTSISSVNVTTSHTFGVSQACNASTATSFGVLTTLEQIR